MYIRDLIPRISMELAETVPIDRCRYTRTQRRLNIESLMSVYVLLNLLNKLRKSDKMPGLPSFSSLFHNEFDKFNKAGARILDSIFYMTLTLF